ncbi:hypothetical protein IV494_05205 [Kaistella sp. G5-32]|uniref:C1q domain-containing protein n=1 Tax=Kaistella gelatinilytica TaxID=2787636 RepID=A0ABS0FA50_9FLAO|nr:hypothetical protein [Kaistella gelatinilytica]MBF8456574.1 hypothetical protein [Kaistella gelatinilytica]
MKKLLSITAIIFGVMLTFAQAPEKFSYQAIIRNASNALVTNANVGMKISILKTSAAGTVVYSESQTAMTNLNGLVSIQIGAGTPITGTIAGINWGSDSYYIKTETDPAGGTNYTIAGTTQLLSVPYALYSKNSGSGSGLTLPYAGTSAVDNINQFKITNTSASLYSAGVFENTNLANFSGAVVGNNLSTGGFGTGVVGTANSNSTSNLSAGVTGYLLGTGTTGAGFYGYAENGYGIYSATTNGKGVLGFSDGTGTAGYFQSGATGYAFRTFGALKLTNIGEGAGKVLTSDAAGNATWQNGTPKVHFSSTGGSTQATPNGILTVINSWTGLDESGGANYNAATGEYTIPVTGYYAVKAQMSFVSSNTLAGPQAAVRIQVDASTVKTAYSNNSIVGEFYSDASVNIEKTFTAGQKVRISEQQFGSATNALYGPSTSFSIHLIHQ